MSIWSLLILTGVGTAAGLINVMAGGGSLLTMPAMIFLGLHPATANGSNRVALLIQNVAAVGEFRRRGFSDTRTSLSLAACTLPGAILGAVGAVRIDPITFKRILALVMVAVLVAVLTPRRREGAEGRRHPIAAHLAMVAVGFYGGFVQAGVGFLIIAAVHRLLDLDLVRVNMHKVFIILLYTVPTLVVFAVTGHVSWVAGVALGIGNMAGAWAGTRAQIAGGERWIRGVLVVAVLAMAAKLLLG